MQARWLQRTVTLAMVDFNRIYSQDEASFGVELTPGLEKVLSQLHSQSVALELGCGDGRDALHIVKHVDKLDCVDKSSVGLSKLLRRAQRVGVADKIRTFCGDVSELKLNYGAYDLIVSVTLFDHLWRSDAISSISQMLEKLRAGAWVFVQVHTVEDPAYSGGGAKSEYSGAIKTYFRPGELLSLIPSNYYLRFYEERVELDADHGEPHNHGFAVAICKKLSEK